MSDTKKYYWLKLKRDFFKRHDTRVIESMENGEKYLLFYLKLLVESLDHNGNLRFSETVPYNDKMLSAITFTDIDIVRSAIKVFTELNMIEMIDDGTLYMNQVNSMIGSDTEWAAKKAIYRQKQKELGQKEDMSDKSIDIRVKSIELRDKKEEVKPLKKSYDGFENVLLTEKEYQSLVDNYGYTNTLKLLNCLDAYKQSKGKTYKSDMGAIRSWVLDKVKPEKRHIAACPRCGATPFAVICRDCSFTQGDAI